MRAYCVLVRVTVRAGLLQTEALFFQELTQETVYK